MAATHPKFSPESRAGLGGALAVLALVSLLELSDGHSANFVGFLAVAPLLAAAFTTWREVLAVGLLATALTAVFNAIDPVGFGSTAVIRMITMAVVTGIAIGVSVARERRYRHFAELSRLATVAQETVVRPLGPQVGQLAVAGRYVSASVAADIGGDLYEALATPFGVRMIIGDVQGKGIDAIRLASIVLGTFRHVAFEKPDLRQIVNDLEAAVARSAGDEEFVTAALVEERGGTLTVVNCGHPAPLLLRRGEVIALDPPKPAPPLGLNPTAQPRVEHLEPGDRLLLYTDGLAEARRAGAFFPTTERAWALLGHGTVEHGLASLESALQDWVNRHVDDDIALLLLEYTGGQSDAEGAVPSWEIGGTTAARF
jgi:hypothetical protein